MYNTFNDKIKRLLALIKNSGKSVTILQGCRLSPSNSYGGHNNIGRGSLFIGKIGFASYIGDYCSIIADIGKYCCIASHVTTTKGSHPIHFLSMHPAFYSTTNTSNLSYVKEETYNGSRKEITIGNDVWIGESVTILDGISIGDGAVIAAGAVVVSDVAPYTIVGGVPAKKIRNRFTDEEISDLLKLKWWDKSNEWLAEHSDLFGDVSNISKLKDD